jgi:hypothetical protein
MGAVAGTEERLMVSVWRGGMPGAAVVMALRSRTASEWRSVLAEILRTKEKGLSSGLRRCNDARSDTPPPALNLHPSSVSP